MLLNEKIIVVTGGAGLLGQSFIECVVENGGIGVIADINADIASKCSEKLSKELESNKIFHVEMDINSKESIDKAIGIIGRKYGRIDGWINSAYPRNKNFGRKFFEIDYADFCENVNLNLGGYFLTSQRISLYFEKQGFGNIINISSIYGVIAPRFEIYDGTGMLVPPPEYAVIKSALLHLTKYMAKLFKGMNIRVNAITPGGILDHQHESFLKRYQDLCLNKGMLDKSDLKGAVLFLLSELSTYVNGQNIVVDDGFTL